MDSKRTDTLDPPQYTAIPVTTPRQATFTRHDFSPKIKATDFPQWRWTQSQCREWLVTVLVTYLDYTKKKATATAAQFNGFGPVLFMMGKHEWRSFTGSLAGEGIYALIVEAQNKDGGIPPHMEITNEQYEPEPEVLPTFWRRWFIRCKV